MKKHYRILLCLIPLLIVWPLRAAAQGEGPTGSFTINHQASDDVNLAIEAVISRMSFVTRPTTRARLKKENQVYKRVVIARRGRNVSVKFDGLAPMVSRDNGQPVKWAGKKGDNFDLSTEMRGGALVQTLKSERETITRTFTTSQDGGTLTLHVEVRSARLPSPLNYKLVFNRAQ